MFEMSGAELIIELLKQHGITQVAGIPGGFNLPLYDAMARDGHIEHILARHEQGAGFMAQGMARSTGRAAVCFATSGPGATNVLTALADARLDAVPIICITGQVPTAMLGTDAFQEVDIVSAATSITKKSVRVTDAVSLLTIIPDAFHDALSGKPGPVLIDVPKDIQLQRIAFSAYPQVRPNRRLDTTDADTSTLNAVAQRIDSAKRPILYLGGGAIHNGGADAAIRLAERCDIPTVCTLMALGAMKTTHPLYLGMGGMHGDVHTNTALDRCDLLIAVGTRFGDRSTGQIDAFCKRATVIHINISPKELNRLKKADIAIAGDAASILDALHHRLRPQKHMRWKREINALRSRVSNESPESRWPQMVIATVARHCPDALITTDVGQHQMWTARHFPFSFPGQWLTSGGLGTMGFGLPAAIGAALAHPLKQVVCFSGDGSILMNIQELAVLAERQLNVKIVLFNNCALGLVAQQQDLFFGERRFASEFDLSPQFEMIAAGFGIQSMTLDTLNMSSSSSKDFASLAKLFHTRGPCLVNVPIDANAKVLPMVPPGAANREMITREPPSGRAMIRSCSS
ncbi:MAG: biosynthetic-type acetolactate synthase large subunit [Deltaproteobacteria bacterium]|nr:biosynthetic-type acetolactate synthase large subunit [Deltaproteobacteria bacterium]